MDRAVYAVYRGDDFLAMGTAEELAKEFGVKERTIYWWLSPCNKRRDVNHARKVAERVIGGQHD